jgi:cell division protein FtsB
MKFLGFNKLSKEKRKELVLVVLVTAMVLIGLGFGLIKYQYAVLQGLDAQRAKVDKQLDQMSKLVSSANKTESELAASSATLTQLEETMASGDIYLWMIDALRRFKESYRLDIPQVGQPLEGAMNLLPRFPYKQVTLSVSGTSRYPEIGRFLADYENENPYNRILELELRPASVAGDRGMLSFKFDIVALAKPNTR